MTILLADAHDIGNAGAEASDPLSCSDRISCSDLMQAPMAGGHRPEWSTQERLAS